MEKVNIGIVGGGFQGKAEAFWFAKRNINVIVYEISEKQRKKIYSDIKLSPKRVKYEKYVTVTDNLEELCDCTLVIENVPENRELKIETLKKIEAIVSKNTIIASNSSSYIPTYLAEVIKNKERYINIHYLGVNWGLTDLELVPSKYTSESTLKTTSKILYDAGFNPIQIKECPGFVFNRINGIELSNLFRAMEKYKLLGLDTLKKYLLYPIRGHWTVVFIDMLGVEIDKALFEYLHENFGDRAYISNYINERVERNELGVKTGKGFYEYTDNKPDFSTMVTKPIKGIKSYYNNIFVNNVSINQINILLALVNSGKKIYMDSIDTEVFKVLKYIEKRMYDKIIPNINIVGDSNKDVKYDLIIDSKVLSFDKVIESLNDLSERFGEETPIAINTPIYKMESIAKAVKHSPDKIAVFNCQKSYIANTELVHSDYFGKCIYEEMKKFIIELTGDCLEVNDGEARPLMFLSIAKIFEAVRCLEEGISSRDNIIRLMQKEHIFSEADYMGIDVLKNISDYLYKIYGQPFEVPNLINDMVKDKKTGVMCGKGFYDYHIN